jgi:hypothetical protein
MLDGLRTIGDVTPFHFEDGSYGYPCSTLTRVEAATRRLRDYFEDAARHGEPYHVLIGQMWGGYLPGPFLDHLRRDFHCLVLNICMDDRDAFDGIEKAGVHIGTRLLSPFIDIVLTAIPEAVDWHRKEGCPAWFFPEASSSAIFKVEPRAKRYDVGFVGQCYGVRRHLVSALETAGIAVETYGTGWPNGRLSTDGAPRMFAESRIVLGVGMVGHCEDFFALKLRDFDAPMSGSFYLTSHNPDLALVYRLGEEIETYRSIEDCVQKCRYYLANPERREAIARAGQRRAMTDHEWTDRFRRLAEVLRGEREEIVSFVA